MVILDNGHGIETKGKRSPLFPELLEFEFNRDIVRRITNACQILRLPYIVLVPEIRDIPLQERVRRCNEICLDHDDAILLSVHANAGGGTGWEAFTSRGETVSDKIAEVFYKEAEKILSPDFRIRKDRSDGDLDKEANFYILKNTYCPAILTENLFMDFPKDAGYLMTEMGRKKIAQLHIQAIQKLYKMKII